MPDDKEIEINIPVDRQSFLELKNKLTGMARFVKSLRQVDDYFTPAHKNFVEPEYPFEWLSIRRRGGKALLNYKHFHPENAKETTHCDEFETEIDAEAVEKIFAELNFKKLITIDKQREVFFTDEFEIALDSVEELGCFVEIEALKDFGGAAWALHLPKKFDRMFSASDILMFSFFGALGEFILLSNGIMVYTGGWNSLHAFISYVATWVVLHALRYRLLKD